MAEMSMNRVIHGAFRRDLQRFEDALAAFPDGDAGRAEQLWTAWANFDDQLTRHHVGEHEIAWPTLRQLGLSEDERMVLAKVAEVLRKIQFGTVVLVVQDGKVVQVEMAEKFRLR